MTRSSRMLQRTAKLIALVLLTTVTLFAVTSIGPLSHLPSFNVVNEAYLIQVRNHEILLGLSGFVAALLAGSLFREGILTSVVTAILAGVFYYAWSQAGDVRQLSEFLEGLLDFSIHYLLAGACVVIAFLGAKKLLGLLRARNF